MKIAIVGSGLSGLACATNLLQRGYQVHIYEKEKDFGGLAGYTTLGDYRFPKTYHHVLRADKPLNDVLDKFKIPIDWKSVNIGIYADDKIYPFNGPIDLMKFSHLSLIERFRLGWLVLNTKYEEQLRDVTVKDWVVPNAGEKVYEKFVAPLISTYFGSPDNIAAAYLARRWGDESKYASNSLGYADFPQLIDSYLNEIHVKNGVVKNDYTIKTVELNDREVKVIGEDEESFDAVVLTCPTTESKKLLRGASQNVLDQLGSVEYRACLCLALRVEKRISDYYWVNILDRDIPFIACFEHGNLNPKLSGGLVYAVAYVNQTGELWNMKNEEICETFQGGLKKVFGSLPQIEGWALFRVKDGTPVYKVGYRNIDLNPCPRLYFSGVYRAFPEIRSSGPAIRTGIETAEKIIHDFNEK